MSQHLKPHRASILLTINISDVLPTGEATNNPISEDILKEYGLAKHMVIDVNSFDMDSCLQKLKSKIAQFKGD